LNNHEVRDAVCQNCISPEERKRRIREIFGRPTIPHEPPVEFAPAAPESKPVKPSQTTSDDQAEGDAGKPS
jgi:hypothetical protein